MTSATDTLIWDLLLGRLTLVLAGLAVEHLDRLLRLARGRILRHSIASDAVDDFWYSSRVAVVANTTFTVCRGKLAVAVRVLGLILVE